MEIEKRDIFTLDLSAANANTLCLLPKLNVRLIPQLEELKLGSRILSYDLRMKGVKSDKVVGVKSENAVGEHQIYVRTTPLKKGETPRATDYFFRRPSPCHHRPRRVTLVSPFLRAFAAPRIFVTLHGEAERQSARKRHQHHCQLL